MAGNRESWLGGIAAFFLVGAMGALLSYPVACPGWTNGWERCERMAFYEVGDRPSYSIDLKKTFFLDRIASK